MAEADEQVREPAHVPIIPACSDRASPDDESSFHELFLDEAANPCAARSCVPTGVSGSAFRRHSRSTAKLAMGVIAVTSPGTIVSVSSPKRARIGSRRS